MKKTTFKLIALAATLACGGNAPASGFDLASLNVADIKASQASVKVPAAPQPPADELIGMDVNIRLPFKLLNSNVAQLTVTEKRLTIINKAAPVIFKSGEFLKVSNIRVDANGIIVVPTLTLKPYLEGRDKLAIKIQRIQLHASMEPSVKSAQAPVTEEQVMEQVMDVMIKGIYSSLNEKLKAKKIDIKAEEVVALKYNKADWTLRAALSSKALSAFIPAGLVGELHLTGFSFSDAGLVLKVQTAE